MGAAGIELHIGDGSRIPSVRTAVVNANENDYDAVIRLIEQVADPREYLGRPEKLKAIVEYLNARLRGDNFELVKINDAFKLRPFPPTEAVTSATEEKVEMPISSNEKCDSPSLKAGGKNSAGGDKNIEQQDVPTKKKEKWSQDRTIQAAIIGAFALILVSCIGWYISYNSGETTDIFAYVSKDGTILRNNDFPWEIRKSKDKEDNVIYIIVGRYGDSSAASVFPDNSRNEYIVYNAMSGVAVKFTCPEEKISNFTIKLKY